MLQWTWEYSYISERVISYPLDVYPEGGLLGHTVFLFLISWGTTILFSVVTVPVYISTNSVQEFPFLHILTSICHPFLRVGMLMVWGDSSLWPWFTFPDEWCGAPSSCTCWPFVYLWKNVIKVPCSFFNWVICFFIFIFAYFLPSSYMSCLYIWLYMCSQYFPHSISYLVICWRCPLLSRSFQFYVRTCCLCSWYHTPK